MCLITYLSDPYVSTEDIITYKIVEKPFNGICKSVYERFTYKLNALYENSDSEEYDFFNKYSGKMELTRNWFHSYITLDKARRTYRNWNTTIVKCIIPKGTKYYIGIDDDICSKKIIIVEECV